MSEPSKLSPGQVINFQLDTDVIKNQFNACKVLSIANLQMAVLVDGSIHSTHASIVDTLPEGTPSNPEDFNYLIVELQDGTRRAFGMPWIKSPVTVVSSSDIAITVHGAGVEDVERISKALNVYGYANFSIDVITS